LLQVFDNSCHISQIKPYRQQAKTSFKNTHSNTLIDFFQTTNLLLQELCSLMDISQPFQQFNNAQKNVIQHLAAILSAMIATNCNAT
jgi:hypothetical protein